LYIALCYYCYKQRVPFRESQITRLFADSLSGWGHTVMIANASPSIRDYDEMAHTLKYAAVAREVQTAHKVDTRNPYNNNKMKNNANNK